MYKIIILVLFLTYYTRCAVEIDIYFTALGQARQFIEICGM
jgi:hypothetical protein